MGRQITKYGRLWRADSRSVLRYSTPRKVLNALRTEWAYRRHISDVTVRPYIMVVEPLYYCNLRCPLCAREATPQARKGKEQAGKLPLDLYDQVLDELGKYLFQVQIFGNGEPTLDWPLTRGIIARAHKRRIFTLMSTNCTLITPAIAEEIVASDLDYIICGIDGLTQETYGAYRVGGKLEAAMNGMKLLVEQRRKQKRKLFIEWQFLVNRFNCHEIGEAQRLSIEFGVYLRPTPISGIEANPELRKQWSAEISRQAFGDQTACGTDCTYLWRIITLNSNGQVALCNHYANIGQLGTARDRSVIEIFNGPSTRRARQLFSRGPVPEGDFPWPCTNCALFQRHHGGPALDVARVEAAKYKTVPLTMLNASTPA